ncbi:MAG: hypothetical protein HDT46_07000 [Ruminococcaceae bacterium]|nr:hypothetical protein [Oscillospiraceae bacterium]
MADEKITKAAEKTAKTTPAAAKAPAEKKTAAKKPAEKAKTTRTTKTTKAVKAAKPAATRAKKSAKTAVTLDDLTTAIWKKLEKKNVKDIPYAVAIQVNVFEIGTFYIAVNADPEYDKQVIQSDYYLADGIVDTSAEEIKKIASGDYDFIAAVKAGKFNYRGDLNKGVCIAGLIK